MIMILKKWILGPQRAGFNNNWETDPKDSMLAARYLGFWGLGLGGLWNLILAQGC